MSADPPKKRPFFYGSAGMAASGMIPNIPAAKRPVGDFGVPLLPGPEPEPEPEVVEQEPELQPETEESVTLSGDSSQPLKGAILRQWEGADDGCDFQRALQGVPGMQIVGLSDPDKSQLEKLRTMFGGGNAYTNHQDLLETEAPNVVAVEASHTSARYKLVRMALEFGAHVICGQPFAHTLKEADELIAMANDKGLRFAVANSFRAAPNVIEFASSRQGLIGDLLEIRLHGALNRQSGGIDLLLQGLPLFDMARLFAGPVSWCSAHVTTNGERALQEDRFDLPEMGLYHLLGDRIHAQFLTETGILVNFLSDERYGDVATASCVELIGHDAIARIHKTPAPTVSIWKSPDPEKPEREDEWTVWHGSNPGYNVAEPAVENVETPYRDTVANWLGAIRGECSLLCGAERAREALEMAHGVWQSGFSGKRAYFPLVNLFHPLGDESL